MKSILFSLLLIFTAFTVNAQKVATYSTGTPGEDDYESFGFWIKDGKRSFVSYSYGAERTAAKVAYAGMGSFKGIKCFKIQFSNKFILYVMINGDQLQIAGNKGDYLKTFKWEYEGPVNGTGTSCNVCAKDADEAIDILKEYYQTE